MTDTQIQYLVNKRLRGEFWNIDDVHILALDAEFKRALAEVKVDTVVGSYAAYNPFEVPAPFVRY